MPQYTNKKISNIITTYRKLILRRIILRFATKDLLLQNWHLSHYPVKRIKAVKIKEYRSGPWKFS